MKHLSTLAFCLLSCFLFSQNLSAQQYSKAIGGNTSQLLFGSNTALHSQLLYDSADLHRHEAGKIDRIYFRKQAGNATTLTNVVIRLGQTSLTGGFGLFSNTFFTGLTQVYAAASYTVSSSATDSWFSFDITAFPYDPTQRLIVDITYSTTTNSAFTVLASTAGTVFGGRKRLYANNSTSPTGTTSATWEDFGIDMAPENDECTGAIELLPGAKCNRTVTGTTFAASQSFPASMCDGSLSANADDDVWYSFIASGNGDTISVSAIDSNFDPIVDVYNSCPPDVRVACSDKTTTGGSETVRMPSLIPGATYYVRVYSFDQVKGRFTICLRNKNNPCTTPDAFIKANKTETVSNGSVLLELLSPLTGSLIWEQSLDHGNTWTSTGQFDIIDTVLARVPSTDTIYYRANTQFGNCDPAYSNIVKVFVRCATTIAIPPKQAPLYISQVAFQGVRNVSTFDTYGGAYQDFRSLTGHFCRSNASNLVIYTSPSNFPVNRLVWIDLNRDGDFEDSGEKFYAGSLVTADSVVVPINIKKNIAPGPATMRISIFWDNESQAGAGPCDGGLYFYGEIEEYTINIHAQEFADAGTSGFNCGSTRTMNANAPTEGQGTWSVFNGTGTANFANINNPNTVVTGLSNGLNVLQWTISSSFCPSDADTVEIRVNQPIQANAGTDMVICTTFVTVNGNGGPVGTIYSWTKLSGNGSLSSFGGSSAFLSGMTGISDLKFGLTVPGCPISEDTIRITNVGVNSEANAGGNQTVCGSTAVMDAEVPLSGFGTWSVISGSGTFSNINDPSATVSGLSVGANIFRWTITNLPCPTDFDEVTINSVLPVQANAGPDIAVCTTSVSISGNTGPTGTTYNWSKISGSGTIIPILGSSGIVYFGMGIGTSVLEFTLNRPGCPPSKDTVLVTRAGNPTTADAGISFFVCKDSAKLDANIPIVGTGKWTVVTGTGQFENDADPKTWVRGLTDGGNLFRWTISSNPCTPSTDEVGVYYLAPMQADAGPDQQVCTTFVQLIGNEVDTYNYQVSWQQILGSGQITNAFENSTLVLNLSQGLNRFVYSVLRVNCTVPTTDTIDIINATPQTAVAGPIQIICSASTQLAATPPTAGTGRWSVVSGSGTFDNVNSPTATISNLPVGNTVLKWKVTNNPCPADSATVTITRNTINQAIAGTDQVVCTTSVVVAGNFPPANGTTRWTRLTGTGLVNSPNSRATAITQLGIGTSTYEYKITVPGCGETKDTLSITRNTDPTAANAGQDQNVCADFVQFSANAPQVGTGKWTVINGTGTFANDSDPNTTVSGLSVGFNQFRWTISNNPCPASSDDVGIIRFLPETAQAGTDLAICSTSVQLTGNGVVQDGVTEDWTQILGTGNIQSPQSSQTQVISLGIGLNRFVYSISVPGCLVSTDTVDIDRKQNPTTANAGQDQTVCGTTATLNGNNAQVGTGTWTRIFGAGTIVSPNNPASQITGLGLGANVFRWTIANAPCANSQDNVTITRNSATIPDAGTDQVICTTFVQLTGNSLGNNPGTVTWTQIEGTGLIGSPNSETTTVNNLSVGLNRFVYTISVPGCQPQTDTVDIDRKQNPTTANAGQDQTVCGTTATLSGNNALVGTGTWTRISGAGTIVSPNNPASQITGLGLGDNVFRWTIANAPCANSQNNVTITRNSAILPDAGTDQVICTTFVQLTGNSLGNNPGTVTWTQIEGTGLIGTPNSETTMVNNLSVGLNRFVYTISVPGCLPITDTVNVSVNQAEIAQVVSDFSTFQSSASLSALNSTGVWTQISGLGTIQNPTVNLTTVDGLAMGENIFVWTFDKAPCPVSDDTLTITRLEVPEVCNGIQLVAAHTSGAHANIQLTSPGNSPIQSYKISFGDGNSTVSEGNGTNELHTYGQPGIFNVCAVLYYNNVFQQPDSCSICDTVLIPQPASPCQQVSVTASHLENMDASISANAPGNSFFMHKVFFGDGSSSGLSAASGNYLHQYAQPGIYNVCARFYYFDVFQQLDSCETCDTVLIPNPPSPCGQVSLTLTPGLDLDATITANAPDAPFFSQKVFFGDGSSSGLNSASGNYLHQYPAAGKYAVCARFYYLNFNQELDSCQVCDSTTVVEFISPCLSFGYSANVSQSTVGFADASPNVPAGWYYDYAVDVAFPTGSMTNVKFQFDDGPKLNVSNYGLPDMSAFAYVLPPREGTRKLCLYGYFTGPDGETDSCVVCKNFDNPYPPRCEFFTLEKKLNCRNQAEVKVWFSAQARLDSVWVLSGSDTILVTESGQAIPLTLSEIGFNKICAVAVGPDFGSGELELPGFTCSICDSLEVVPGPNAGSDETICSSNFTRIGNAIPDGFEARWEVISGDGVINNPNGSTLNIEALSPGENQVAYVFYSGYQTCPEESTILTITRIEPPFADAGPDQAITVSSTTLAASNPTGVWSQIIGSGIVADPTNPESTVSGLSLGLNRFVWMVSAPPCADDSDTMDVVFSDPCEGLAVVAQHSFGFEAKIKPEKPIGAPFFSHKIDFGDGNSSNEFTSTDTVNHIYSGPGTFTVCSRFLYFNELQELDSCTVCDTVNIPVPLNACDFWSAGHFSTQFFDAIEFDSIRGRYYSLLDSIAYQPGLFFRYKIRVSDSETDAQDLLVENPLSPTQSTKSFHLVVPPGKKKICYTGFYINAFAQLDSCTICRFDTLDFAPPCTFVELKSELNCRNQIKAKALFSYQSGFDSLWVVVGNNPPIAVTKSGDSVIVNTNEVGSVLVRFLARLPGGGSISLPGLPNFDCSDFDTIEIASPPDAGLDATICSTNFTRIGNTIPNGYEGRWEVVSGDGVIPDPLGITLTINGLSVGENKVAYIFYKNDQSCPEEADTLSVIRFEEPSQANAGLDQMVCSDESQLTGQPTFIGSGLWSLISGNGEIQNPASGISQVTNLGIGDNTFVWTISNGICPSTSDTLLIHRYEVPTMANAGSNQTLCIDQTNLDGNVPLIGTGTWTVVSGAAVLADPTLANSGVSGLSTGENSFVWTISNGSCPSSTDTVLITVNPPSAVANAGQDQTVCGSDAVMAGNNVVGSNGTWTVIQGTGSFADPNQNNAPVSGLSPGLNVFVWTLSNGLCPATTDTVSITSFAVPTVANAGNDQVLCENQTVLAGNNPIVGTGLWTLVSGSGTIAEPGLGNSSVSNLAIGQNQFVWTISNGICEPISDTILIIVNPGPTLSDAGTDQTLCATQATLNGNIPQSGIGTWTVILGTGTLPDPNAPTATVLNMGVGINELVWSIAVGNCPASTDTVRINVSQPYPVVNAGSDEAICGSVTNLNAQIPLIGIWSVLSGPAVIENPNAANSQVTNLQQGLNGFVWTVQNGICAAQTDTVFITSNLSFAASAGPSLIICSDTAQLNAPSLSAPASGKWTVDQGSGVFEDDTNPTTKVSGISNGLNFFRWTVSVPTCPDLSDTMAVVRIENNLSIHSDTAICFIQGDSLVLSIPLQFTSYTWSNGATTRRIVLYAPDTLIVSGTTAEGCTATDTIRVREGVCDPVSRQIQGGFAVVLQPNPATSEAWMEIHSSEPRKVKLIVFNALGQEFGQEKTWHQDSGSRVRLETDSWPSGLYTIKLTDGKRFWTGKLVVRH